MFHTKADVLWWLQTIYMNPLALQAMSPETATGLQRDSWDLALEKWVLIARASSIQ